QRRVKDWHVHRFGHLEKQFFRLNIAAENHAGDFMREQVLVTSSTLLRWERLEKCGFRAADNLHPLAGEIFCEAREGEPGTVNGRFANDSVQPLGTGHQFKLEPYRMLR